MKPIANPTATLRVFDIMTPCVITISPATSLTEAADLMAHHRLGALPVVDEEGALEGMLTAADIVWVRAHQPPEPREPAAPAPGAQASRAQAAYWYHLGLAEARRRLTLHAEPGDGPTVETACSPAPITVDAHASVTAAAHLMLAHGVHHLPVLERGKLTGLVSTLDIVRAYEATVPKRATVTKRAGAGK